MSNVRLQQAPRPAEVTVFGGRVHIRSSLSLEELGRLLSDKLFAGAAMVECTLAGREPAIKASPDPFGLHVCLERDEDAYLLMIDSTGFDPYVVAGSPELSDDRPRVWLDRFSDFFEHRLRELGFDARRLKP